MKYRHAHHAGNFADVHKHITMLALIEALQRKPKGYLLIDTHAGRGSYELPRHGGTPHESNQGIARLLAMPPTPVRAIPAPPPPPPEIANYIAAVRRFQETHGGRSAYPGSPELAAATLRATDRAVFAETQHEEFLVLRRALERQPRVRLAHEDGFRALAAALPPIERRALVLMDPPFEESREDFDRLRIAVAEALGRFETGVFALWYPIKQERDSRNWIEALGRAIERPLLVSEIWVHPRDSRVGLNGSGVAIVNAPYQIAERMRVWMPALWEILDESRAGGWSVSEPQPDPQESAAASPRRH